LKTLLLMPFALAAASAQGAVVQPSHIYEFTGNTLDGRGGPAMQAGTGSSYTGTGPAGGLRFASNLGPVVSGAVANPGLYSLELFFSLDQMSGYRRVVDWKNGTDEDGLYFDDGDLNFYGQNLTVDTNLAAGQLAHVVVTRDGNQRVRVFFNGTERISFADGVTKDGVFSGPDGIARFFRDNGNEASAGFVDFIRIYDRVLDGSDVTALYNNGTPLRDFIAPTPGVPEPGTWAMMLTGFGLASIAVRRRRVATLVPA
jgi:hypothetical protein